MFVRGLLVLAFVTAAAFAAPVPKGMKKATSKWDAARFDTSYTKVPLGRMLEDFAAEVGLEWVCDQPPPGTITLKLSRQYTAVEMLDLLNERLEIDNCILLRCGATLHLHPADKPIDPERVDTVTVEDILPVRQPAPPPVAKPVVPGWDGVARNDPRPFIAEPPVPPKRGRTEVATLVIELPNGLAFADIAPQIKKSVSPFGRFEEDESGKGIRVTDRVDTLRLVARILDPRVR